MRVLDFGGWRAAVSLDTHHGIGLDSFLDRAAVDGPTTSADLSVHVASGAHPHLRVDIEGRHVALTVPEKPPTDRASDPAIAIAVLQAAARCLALVRPAECALLHGGAVTSAEGQTIAVLDGGRGQGKTSLALALGLAKGQLLADEFLFTTAVDGSVVTEPAAHLPWHIRQDMAPYVLPERPGTRLAFPDDFDPSVRTAAQQTTIDVVLLPDVSRPTGVVRRVPRGLTAEVLHPAINDHRAKLLDPTLDHVSLFTSADQLTTTNGSPLAGLAPRLDGAADQVHALLADLPVYLVGIGKPSDIKTSAEAVRHVLRST